MSDEFPLATPWLPGDLAATIGIIISKHSYLEMMLQHIAYEIAGVDAATGRIAFREPRAADRVSMIQQLALIHDISLDAETVEKLKSDLPKSTTIRDQLAHGVFFEKEGSDDLYLGVLAGNWQPEWLKKGKISRRVESPAYKVDIDNLTEIAAIIQSMIDACRDLRSSVEEQKQRRPQ